jgi:Fic family protein
MTAVALSLFEEIEAPTIYRNKRVLPKTSIEAYKTVGEMKQAHYAKIVSALNKLGGKGTYEEISVFAGINKDQVNRRLSEMERDGTIRNTGENRKTVSGRKAMVRELIIA